MCNERLTRVRPLFYSFVTQLELAMYDPFTFVVRTTYNVNEGNVETKQKRFETIDVRSISLE